MPRPTAATWSIVGGLLLSITLPGCTPRAELVEKPVPVAVKVKDTPPAELLACADRPDGLPEDPQLVAQMPTRLRAGVIRLARAYAAVAARLDRLIDWTAPGTCAAATKD